MEDQIIIIGDHENADQQQGERRYFYQDIIETAQVIILVLNTDGKIVGFNPYMESICGYKLSEVKGKDWFKTFLPKRDRAKIKQVFTASLSDNPIKGYINPILTKDGKEIEIEWYDKTLKDEKGEVTGILATGQDVTERLKAEARQTDLLGQLESAISELSSFAYIISHDLKAPLRAIKGLLAIIKDDLQGKLDSEQQENFDLVLNRADRMQALIDGVLEYSRVGRMKEQHVDINLNELIKDTLELILVPGHIKVKVQNNLPTINSEPTRIRQVFQNLISNAIKYMDKEKGLISVSCEPQDNFWKFSVKDNGPGIKEDDYGRVFELFQTLQSKDSFESTGVGLTLVKKIVEMYGGHVSIESVVGKGSTFSFTLPVQAKITKTEKTAVLA